MNSDSCPKNIICKTNDLTNNFSINQKACLAAPGAGFAVSELGMYVHCTITMRCAKRYYLLH